ncbi:immunity 53 family protein [Grimontia sp. SpTr1]|uniref:immunity 53 family protein n=1 Tax=Grimontia sp. SpTr1 TaxID=2995319 RepID=UPI00248CF8FF|nr:immunity 53 family protein [Grimontia sp. SpTr1]
MDTLKKLQDWYLSQCNDDWEHSFGMKIDTLDNPGWSIKIDLSETSLDKQTFTTVEVDYESDKNWIFCKVENNQFIGACGPLKLEAMLNVFLDWAANGN